MDSAAVHPSLRAIPVPPAVERVTFLGAFEGLFLKAFGDRMTPAVQVDLKAIGFDLDRPQVAYPQAIFVASLDVASRHWFEGEPVASAYFKLGVRNMEGFFETLLGRPMLALLKLVGPRRTLARMKTNFRSANNYTDAQLVETGPNRFQLWVNEPGDLRFFMQGVMERGVQLAGAPNVHFEVLEVDALGTVYDVRL